MQIPAPLRTLYDWWMRFAHVLGRIMSTVLLTVLWVVGFGVYAVLLRIGNALAKKSAGGGTHWRPCEEPPEDHWRYQF